MQNANIQFINSNPKLKSIINKTCVKLIFRMNLALHKGKLNACIGKKGYNSYYHALRTIEKRDQKGKVIYPCPHCFTWHIGTDEDNELIDFPFEITDNMVLGMNFKSEYESGLLDFLDTLRELNLI